MAVSWFCKVWLILMIRGKDTFEKHRVIFPRVLNLHLVLRSPLRHSTRWSQKQLAESLSKVSFDSFPTKVVPSWYFKEELLLNKRSLLVQCSLQKRRQLMNEKTSQLWLLLHLDGNNTKKSLFRHEPTHILTRNCQASPRKLMNLISNAWSTLGFETRAIDVCT